MPLIGLALGAPLGAAIGGAADYVAIGVLLAFGLYTLLARERDCRTPRHDVSAIERDAINAPPEGCYTIRYHASSAASPSIEHSSAFSV